MMKCTPLKAMALAGILWISTGCSQQDKKTALPPAPAGTEAVHKTLNGKTYITTQAGFYGAITMNDKKEVEWVDTTAEKSDIVKKAVIKNMDLTLSFTSDSTVTILKRDTSFAGTYVVDDTVDEYDNGQQGIKLRLTYADPEFHFGSGMDAAVTFTYLVAGIDDKSLLLQTPQSVNNRFLLVLMKVK